MDERRLLASLPACSVWGSETFGRWSVPMRYPDGVVKRSVVPSELSSFYDDWRMSPGLAPSGLLFLTGMTGHRPDGSFADDTAEQIRDAFAKIDLVLAEAGLGRSAIGEIRAVASTRR